VNQAANRLDASTAATLWQALLAETAQALLAEQLMQCSRRLRSRCSRKNLKNLFDRHILDTW